MAESIAQQLDGSRTRMESRTEAKLRRGMAKAWQNRHDEAACIGTGCVWTVDGVCQVSDGCVYQDAVTAQANDIGTMEEEQVAGAADWRVVGRWAPGGTQNRV